MDLTNLRKTIIREIPKILISLQCAEIMAENFSPESLAFSAGIRTWERPFTTGMVATKRSPCQLLTTAAKVQVAARFKRGKTEISMTGFFKSSGSRNSG